MSRTPGPPLWRAAFRVEGSEVPPWADALEEHALSVSLLAIDDPVTTDTHAWQVELLLAEEPVPAVLRAGLAPLLGEATAALDGLEIAQVPSTDWLAAVARAQEPMRVGRFFVHAGGVPVPTGLVGIEVEAGLAFGSGEHATTQLCLEAIDGIARVRRLHRVLDMGCGSGILAIATARCWPARVVAVDNDPIAVRVGRENVALNGVAGQVAAIVADDPADAPIRRRGPYDLILANILANPLIAMAPTLTRQLAPGGRLVLSGLLDRQAEGVVAAYRAQGLRFVKELQQGPWRALVLRAPHCKRRTAPL